jgi:hypothetical protein
VRIRIVALSTVLAALSGTSCGDTTNILLSHRATNRAVVYREVELRQPRVCESAPCPAGTALWSGRSDHTGMIAVPKALLSEPVEVRVRGFRPIQGMPLKRILSNGFVVDLTSVPSSETPPGTRNGELDRAPDATVTVLFGGRPVANRKVSLREEDYCESPKPQCGPGEEIWSGATDDNGAVGLSKWTLAFASAVEVEGFDPAPAWDLRSALRNTPSRRAELRLMTAGGAARHGR